jgi:small subunit ribosomal protein S5
MRTVLESAGFHNVLAKSLGTSNANNVIKATFDALSKMRTPYMVSSQRGIKLDKIFNG